MDKYTCRWPFLPLALFLILKEAGSGFVIILLLPHTYENKTEQRQLIQSGGGEKLNVVAYSQDFYSLGWICFTTNIGRKCGRSVIFRLITTRRLATYYTYEVKGNLSTPFTMKYNIMYNYMTILRVVISTESCNLDFTLDNFFNRFSS